MEKRKGYPIILLVYKELCDELHYIPDGGTLFDWTKRKDLLEHTCSKLIQTISTTEQSNPGNNIYLIPWDATLRKLLAVRYDSVISIVPKWLFTDNVESYIAQYPEIVFRLSSGLTLKDVKPWMIKYRLPNHRWLATIFPKLRKFI